MTEETKFFETLFRTPADQFIDTLDMLLLVDVGIIVEVDVNGRATVSLSKVKDGTSILLQDIEVISFGNNNGGFTVNGAGCPCLIFAPRTTMPNLKEGKVDWGAPAFSKGGIKALPISNGRDLIVNACFSSDGTFNIITDTYSLSFNKDLISTTVQSGLSTQINNAGEISVYRRTENSGILRFSISDGGITFSFRNLQNTSLYEYSLLDDGSFDIVHKKPGDSEKILNRITISEDGSVAISAPGNISIGIDAEGKLTISTGSDVSLTTKGGINISSDGNVSVSASSVNINGGNLEVSS